MNVRPYSMGKRENESCRGAQNGDRLDERAPSSPSLHTLAAALAHRLRNPLTSIKIIVQAAAEHGQAGVISGRALQVLNEEVLRLEHTIDLFLDYARPTRAERQSCDIGQLLQQLLKRWAGRAAQQAVTLDLETPREPIEIPIDAKRFEQAVTAVLANAIEATPTGTTVRIRAAEVSVGRRLGRADSGDGQRWVSIDIADEGTGVPAEMREQIFAPFVTTKETGVGLDLTLCRHIIRQHGGDVTVDQQPQGGAVFTVWLPLQTAAETP